MPATYEKIATTTLGSAASSITFSSISSGYTDLRIILVAKNTTTATPVRFQFNSDTGANYSHTSLVGTGSVADSTAYTDITFLYADAFSVTHLPTASNTFELVTIDIQSYAGSTYKTSLTTVSSDKNGSGGVSRAVGLWRSTAAISSIYFYVTAGQYDVGTTATLYGILKA
jgi:hypothetical protein